jgi:hypothetical protein
VPPPQGLRIAFRGLFPSFPAARAAGDNPRMTPYRPYLTAALASLSIAACSGGSTLTPTDGGGSSDAAAADPCALAAATAATATINSSGCHVLDRDTSACQAARAALGLGGYWLKFSCRVTLSATTDGGAQAVAAKSDGRPDYRSSYFAASDACYETYTGGIHNPNSIAVQSHLLNFSLSPNTTATSMAGIAIIGLALNGVPIFANNAGPGDADIYKEARTFDRCGGHPEERGTYHYHSEPYALSYDDARLIGVMRDGYPIYGRKDPGGGYPTLDGYGGHTGVTVDSPATAVYHYHVNEQTSTTAGTKGEKQWFLATGMFRGTPASCSTCK